MDQVQTARAFRPGRCGEAAGRCLSCWDGRPAGGYEEWDRLHEERIRREEERVQAELARLGLTTPEAARAAGASGRKLPPEAVEEIRRRCTSGPRARAEAALRAEIAARYGVSLSAVALHVPRPSARRRRRV
jgi:hypothetical protein